MTDEELAEIEREVAVGWTLPGRRDAFALTTMTELVAEVARLRAFVRKVYDAARLPDDTVLENTTALEWETADLLGLTPDER